MTMIEKVARAIYASHPFNDNHDSPHPGFDGLTPDWRETLFANARAALEAMREPTPEMLAAFVDGDDPGYTADWQAMIDAALTEPSSSTPVPSRSE